MACWERYDSSRARIVLAEIFIIRWESVTFFRAMMRSRLVVRIACSGSSPIDSMRLTLRNITRVGASAVTETISGSPGRQAYASANTSPGSSRSMMLRLPHASQSSMVAPPASTMPRDETVSPARQIVSPRAYVLMLGRITPSIF